MARNMNFRATISLSAKEFQRGVRAVQASLNSLRMKFMSFAASIAGGIGLGSLGKELAETAKQMDKAQTTLKNVSNGSKEYAENQKFLMDTANKYNQNIIVLTENFAKFHSSADHANVSLEDQLKIFDSLSRASAFYNLSADETNGVFLAITQMMSKGKVSSEELRRQLGERLPGAMGLMAKALGMTTGELDKALRNGEIMAADALPKLADELNKVTKNFDVDTIQGWTNRLKNAFVDLSKSIGVEKIYKGILKGGTKTVSWISKHIKDIQNLLVGLATAFPVTKFINAKSAYDRYFDELQAKLDASKGKIQGFAKQLDVLEGDGRKNPLDFKIYTKPTLDNRTGKMMDPGIYERSGNLAKLEASERRKIQKVIKDCNSEIAASNRMQTELNSKVSFTGRLFRSLGSIMKSAFTSIGIGALITAFSVITSKLIQLGKEAKKVKNYLKDMNKEFKEYTEAVTDEQAQLSAFRDRLNVIPDEKTGDTFEDIANEKNRIAIVGALNKMLGLQGKEALSLKNTNDEINEVIDKRISLIKKQREQEKANEQLTEARNDLIALEKEKKRLEDVINNAIAEKKKTWNRDRFEYLEGVIAESNNRLENPKTGILKQIADKNKLISERAALVTDLALALNAEDKSSEENYGGASGSYAEIQKEFAEKAAILAQKLADNVITQEEYDKALKSLVLSTLDSIYELAQTNKSIKVGGDAFSKGLLEKLKELNQVDTIADFKKAMSDYSIELVKLKNRFASGDLDTSEFNTAMSELVEKTYTALSEMGYMSGELSAFAEEIKKLHEQIKNGGFGMKSDFGISGPEKRKTLFDYSKTDSEIKYEEADRWKEQAEKLKQEIQSKKNDKTFNGDFDLLNDLLDEAIKKADDLEDAADLAKVKEDVKSLNLELASGVTSGISDVANALDRVKSGFESMTNPDLTGFERMLMVINMIVQSTETLLQTMQMFESIKKLIDSVAGAEAALGAVSDANSKKAVSGAMTEVSANAAKGASSAGAEAAKLPFPANIAAIGAAIAAAVALFASIPKFEKGGIVGGNSKSGDKILARLNSGEMVLNKAQQNALLNGSGANVQFKIKGSDLIGVMNNYRKKITK